MVLIFRKLSIGSPKSAVNLEPLLYEHLILGSDNKNLWYNMVLTLTCVFDLEIQTLALTADVSSIAGTVVSWKINDGYKMFSRLSGADTPT
jgi:hypothetical protein